MASQNPVPSAGGVLLIAAGFWAVFIIYGSLVPFALRPSPAPFVWQVTLDPSGTDWVSNVLIGLVLAYLTAGAVWAAGPFIAPMFTMTVCATVSVGVEYAQTFILGRVATAMDVAGQVFGATLGIILWAVAGHRLGKLIADTRQPGTQALRAGAILIVVGYAAFVLFPFDFTTTRIGELFGASFFRALQVFPQDAGSNIRFLLVSAAKLCAVMPLGALIAMNPFRPVKDGFVRAVIWGALLSFGLLVIKMGLLASGGEDVWSFAVRAAGAPAGFIVWRVVQSRSIDSMLLTMKRIVLPALPLYLLAVIAVRGVLGGRMQSGSEIAAILERTAWLPFYYGFAASSPRAVASFVGFFLLFAPLGVFYQLMRGPRRNPVAIGLIGLLAGILLETAVVVMAGHRPDPSNAIIAALAAAGGAHFWYWLVRSTRLHLVEVEQVRAPRVTRRGM